MAGVDDVAERPRAEVLEAVNARAEAAKSKRSNVRKLREIMMAVKPDVCSLAQAGIMVTWT